MRVRKARTEDLSRVAEIFIFNNRLNYLPIFQDEDFSFGELQVLSLVDGYLKKEEVLDDLYVYDDGLVKGFIQMDGTEICKLYVEPYFQSQGIGHALLRYAVDTFHAAELWALEKNSRAIAFYGRHGFYPTGEKKFEEGTTEYLVRLKRRDTIGDIDRPDR